ncbi:MAG: SH3 domain-containing protein [Candidatus Limiplasma sp.]|nr:SH3 domain-containing protein [Candidatus Limiplasma sp.]
MNKRLISLALATLMLAMAAFPVAALGGALGETWHAYVYTSNGKGLNLRPTPSTAMKPIATIPYGAKVTLYAYIDQTWVEVDYGSYHGFVMGRYLTYDQPPPKPKPQPAPKPTVKPDPDAPTSFKKVFSGFAFTSYTAQVRPSTPGGYVHMRWAPTKASDPIQDYHQNDLLNVISQNNTWAQVVDPETGVTGFMMRAFLTEFGVGQPNVGEGSGS